MTPQSQSRCQHSRLWFARIRILVLLLLVLGRAADAFHPNTASFARKGGQGALGRLLQEPSRWSLSKVHKDTRWILNRSPVSLRMQGWEGDDLRWSTKLRRRLRQQRMDGDATPIKTSLLVLNVLLFVYQSITTVNYIRRGHPAYWPGYAIPMIADAVVGSAVNGPLTADFAFSNALSQTQPHRFLTSGFLHGGIVHLLFNMDAFRRQPSWLETGLKGPLYLTAFLISIVTGNLGHMFLSNNPLDRVLCLGSSSGIFGLYGLMYAALVKMGNKGAASRVAKGMAILLVMGLFLENVSTAAHVGGFLGGLCIGILCGPSYRKNYSLRRKNSVEYDPTPRDYRQAMGYGVMPTDRGILPLPLLWFILAVLFAAAKPKFRAMPAMVLKGLLVPGSLTY
jgi:membrane associated rhomboid family serine protease